MSRRFLLPFVVFVVLTASTTASAVDGTTPLIRWGLSLGALGHIPLGSDTSQPNTTDDEFEPGVALHLELLTLDIGSYVQLVPYLRTTLAGGVNEDSYEQVISTTESLAGDTSTHMTHIGLGTRFFPFGADDWFRPYVSGAFGYVTAGARYQVNDIDPVTVPEAFSGFVSPTDETWRHTGIGLTLGAGLRVDVPTQVPAGELLIVFALEVQWTKHFWLDLENNPDRSFDQTLLAPEEMDLDALGVLFTVGFLR